MKTIFLFLILITSLHAEVLKRNTEGDFTLNSSSFKISEVLSDYAKLMNYNLSVSSDFQDEKFTVQGVPMIKKDQIENYISVLLSQSGNAVIRMPNSNYLKVISGRDIRYTPLPIYKTLDEIPKNENQAQFSHALKYIDSSELSRNMRPFLSRYGRIIDIKHANAINITDTGTNLRKMAQIALHLDTEEFKKSQKEIEDINEKHKQSLKPEKSLIEILTQNSGMFIFIFFLIGLIFGFGTRGYMMKKVEGGW
jgi:general secretion pathway protein D